MRLAPQRAELTEECGIAFLGVEKVHENVNRAGFRRWPITSRHHAGADNLVRSRQKRLSAAVLTLQCLGRIVLRVCHRMSSHPATPVQLDHCIWNLSLMVASR